MQNHLRYTFIYVLIMFLALPGPLTAQRGNGNGGGRPGGGGDGGTTKAYRAAEVFTLNSFQYGRFEFRMKAAQASGVISNFFTWKENSELTSVDWEEIDIEVFGKDGANTWQSNLITVGNPRTTSEEVHAEPQSLADDYHEYVLEWTPASVSWYVDGVLRRQSTGTQVDQLFSAAQMRFNIWNPNIEAWVGPFDPAVLPVQMFVSYVRYFSYENGNFVFQWEDSFDGFDTNRWGKADWTFAENLSQFDPANAETRDGKLILGITQPESLGYQGPVPADPLDVPYGDGTGGGGGGGDPIDAIAPSSPGDLSITGTTACTASLSWTSATDNVGVTGYNVYANGVLNTTVTGTSATLTGLSGSTRYQFDVTAFDAAGNESTPATLFARTKKRGCSNTAFLAQPHAVAASPALRVFPNPVVNELSIAVTDAKIAAVELIAGDGRRVIVRQFAQPTERTTVSTVDLPQGVYVCRVTDSAGVVEQQVVVVRR